MSTPPRPRLKSLSATPDLPRPAEQAPTPSGSSAPKVVAEGVPSAVRPDPRTDSGLHVVARLRITAPRGATPTAASSCMCGRDLFASGHHQVLALIESHAAHRTTCQLHTPQEERNAA
ncbi:hypothetical protein ACFWNG_21490 [Streptomyces sp. NPDC058391]|uniref:hypothetical protein n=1 Tax=Streptomyces sp. NPDC058391 TaxID=3346476 RepID=UPI0036651E96